MPEPNPNSEKSHSSNLCFSFAYTLNKCVEAKNKHFFFTNQVESKDIKKYRTIIEKALQNWSTKSLQKLESDRDCYPVKKDKINETRNNIAKVFQAANYPTAWIEQNIQDPDIYKFKISKQIRIFGIVERNLVYILLYDIWHLINKDKEKNFPLPSKRSCTWCLKDCNLKK